MGGIFSIITQLPKINNKQLFGTNISNGNYCLQKILYDSLNTNIYNLIFNDIVLGSSGTFNAGKGYDNATGLGSPNIPKFIYYLANYL